MLICNRAALGILLEIYFSCLNRGNRFFFPYYNWNRWKKGKNEDFLIDTSSFFTKKKKPKAKTDF